MLVTDCLYLYLEFLFLCGGGARINLNYLNIFLYFFLLIE